MRIEQGAGQLVDPRSFLEREFEGIETGRLAQSPDINLLKFLPSLRTIPGIYRLGAEWFAIKGSEIGFPAWAVPPRHTVMIHSHSYPAEPGKVPPHIPDPNAVYHASPLARNFISSVEGFTEFLGVRDPSARKFLEWAMKEEHFWRYSAEKQIDFLKDCGSQYILYPWDELDNEKLQRFWLPNT